MEIKVLFIIGLLGTAGYLVGRGFIKLGLTGILGYLIVGFILGPVFKLNIPKGFGEIISSFTLSLVGYTIGISFSFDFLKEMGKKMVIVLIVEVIVTSLCVFFFIYLISKNLPLSILLSSLSSATAPAGTIAVLREWKAKGSLTNMIIAIVGLDDVAGILMFTLGIALVRGILGMHGGIFKSIIFPIWEIIGGAFLGIACGMVFSYLLKKIEFSEDGIFVLSLFLPFFLWGISQHIKVSPILSCMVLGATFINLYKEKASLSANLIDNIMTPFFVLFFGSVGMTIKLINLKQLGAISLLYCIGRTLGKCMGAYWGGVIAQTEEKIKKYLGPALMNQAGVAVGLAYLAFHELPGYENLTNIVLTSIAITTAIFQFVAPIGVQYSIRKAQEVTGVR